MKTQAAIAPFFVLIFASLAAAQTGAPTTATSASASASTSYNDPVFGNHVGVIPKNWPPPTGAACRNSPEEIDDAHTVHALGLTALARSMPFEALYYWRLAYVESCTTPKILVNVAVAAEQAGDIVGAIEALELFEARGALGEQDRLANQQKLTQLRAKLPKPAASTSASTSASASASPSITLVDEHREPTHKSDTPWVAITGFSLAGVGALAGLGFQVWGESSYNSVSGNCHQNICPSGSDFSTLHTARTAMFVGYGVGVVGIGVGILGLTLWRPSNESPKSVSLVFTGNGIHFSGRF